MEEHLSFAVLNKIPAPQKKSWEIIRPEKEGRILSTSGVLKFTIKKDTCLYL